MVIEPEPSPPLPQATTEGLNLRVMICIPCLLVGGTEIHTIALASALVSAGCEVVVCCYYEHDPIMVRALRDRKAEVELLGLDRTQKDGFTRRLGRPIKLTRALRDRIRRHRPHVIHIQYMSPGTLPVIVARSAQVPVVVATVHVTANHYGNRVWLPRYVAAPLCDAFVCVSRVAEESFFGCSSLLSERTSTVPHHVTIPNCVDLALIDAVLAEGASNPLAQQLGLGNGPVVGIVGRLDRLKGHDILLESFARLLTAFPEARLLCVGDGIMRNDLRAQTTHLGINRHVIWAGRMSQLDTFRHSLLMDVVVIPSRLEGFGLVAAEAMALGKPVIGSDVDGLAEVIGRAGGGILVPPEDPLALLDAMIRVLSNLTDRRALGRAGRERAERLFSPDIFAARHVRMYRLISESKRSMKACR
jgi:glycosyltransferase involved in cell wall biosynthesis